MVQPVRHFSAPPTSNELAVGWRDAGTDSPARPLAVVSGKVMFDILPAEYKSLAVRARVKYFPHPYVAIGTAKSRSTGLGMETVRCFAFSSS